MNIIIFLGGLAIGLAISLFFVEREWRLTSRDIGRLINTIHEQADMTDSLRQSAENILNTDAKLIELCKQLIDQLP